MKIESNNFIAAASIAINDSDLQSTIPINTRKAYDKRLKAMFAEGAEHGEAMRMRAAEIKRRTLRNLPDLLVKAEKNMQANGMTVLWAVDAEEANQHVLDIANRHQVKSIIKSKSMLTEETNLNAVLEKSHIEVVETDLGEFIIQLNHEAPSHIIAPIIHKTKPAIRDIMVEHLGMEPTDDAQEMVSFARKVLREKFINADMGITGGNFIIAETGTIALAMNEGNGRMVTSLPRVHVAMVGIEKLVDTVDDYATMAQVLPRSATGQNMPVYTNMVTGPRRDQDADGPDHVYVILVDNGRSDIYTNPKYTESLACIRCSACLNACPVYRTMGGHAYGWVYSGPIGAVVTPLLIGLDNATPLPHASSLCGSCKQVCPVDIDIPRMLLELRHDLVEMGETDFKWKAGIKAWETGMSTPFMYGLSAEVAKFGVNSGAEKLVPNPLDEWRKHRDFPGFAKKSFRQLWKERQQ